MRDLNCFNAIFVGLIILGIIFLCVAWRYFWCGSGTCPDYRLYLKQLWPAFLEGLQNPNTKPVGVLDWFMKWFGWLILLMIIWTFISKPGSYWDPILKSTVSYGSFGACSIVLFIILIIVLCLSALGVK